MPMCSMTFDASLSHFVYLRTFVRVAPTTVDDIFIHGMGMPWTLESISQVFWESCFWGHQIWCTSLRQLHPLFQVKMERRQHTAPVFQSDSLPLAVSFFSYTLIHKHINIQWKLLRSHTDANINARIHSVSLFQKWNYSISQGSC